MLAPAVPGKEQAAFCLAVQGHPNKKAKDKPSQRTPRPQAPGTLPRSSTRGK